MRPQIFVSYSHRDDPLVGPVVALLRASRALIFRDAEQLQPGRKWRTQLDVAIESSSMVVVFWCHHASSSEEVKKEYTAAIDQHKDVLPLLIDDTPLPPELAAYQYIDFRGAFPEGHAVASAAPARGSRTPWVALVVVLALMVGGGAWMSLQTAAPLPNATPGPTGAEAGGAAWLWLAAAVGAAGPSGGDAGGRQA